MSESEKSESTRTSVLDLTPRGIGQAARRFWKEKVTPSGRLDAKLGELTETVGARQAQIDGDQKELDTVKVLAAQTSKVLKELDALQKALGKVRRKGSEDETWAPDNDEVVAMRQAILDWLPGAVTEITGTADSPVL